jgi:hypothetical protein
VAPRRSDHPPNKVILNHRGVCTQRRGPDPPAIGRTGSGPERTRISDVYRVKVARLITGAVPDAELRKITVDYSIEFARVLRSSSPDVAFSFLSGSGADPTGRSRMAFVRYKDEAEKTLLAAGFPTCTSSGPRTSTPWSRGRNQFQLSPVARNLRRVSGSVPQPGDSGRRPGPGYGGRCCPSNR